MSLDEPRNPRHAAMVENDDHPGWLELARRTEAADRATAEQEWRDRELVESPDAEAARWGATMRQAAADRPEVHYDGPPSWGRP